MYDIAVAAAVAAVLGHVFPVWLGFRGGKGVACAFGVFLALTWPSALGIVVVFAVVFALTRYVSLASIVASATLPLFAFHFVKPWTPMMTFGFLSIPLLVIVKHHGNIRRLLERDGEPVWDEAARAGKRNREGGGMSRIAVIGAGAWGTALAISLARRGGHSIVLWSYLPELAVEIKETGENKPFLPGYVVPMDVEVTSDLAAAVDGADIVLCVTPSEHMRGVVGQMAPLLARDQILVSATKGLEEVSLLRMSQVIASVTGQSGGRGERADVCGGGCGSGYRRRWLRQLRRTTWR